MPAQMDKTLEHLSHVDYPASKQDLVEACNKMSDVSEEEKKWFEQTLPDRSYNSADEAKEALGVS